MTGIERRRCKFFYLRLNIKKYIENAYFSLPLVNYSFFASKDFCPGHSFLPKLAIKRQSVLEEDTERTGDINTSIADNGNDILRFFFKAKNSFNPGQL